MRKLLASVALASLPVLADAQGRATIALQVTDGSGSPVAGVQVQVIGPVLRKETTDETGSVRFVNLPAGVHRLRMTREGYITLERVVSVGAGRVARIELMLSDAPEPPPEPAEPAPPPAPEPPPLPIGNPQITAIPEFVEEHFVARDPRKDSLIGCLGSGTATLLQLREPLADHQHADADEWIYVVAGEGTLRLQGRERTLAPGTFSTIPRTTAHALTPRGRNPLIVISIISGEPCASLAR